MNLQKPSPGMDHPGKPKPPSSFTSWKLEIQKAAVSDPRIVPTQLRMLLYVLHQSFPSHHPTVAQATVADEAIMEDVPGFGTQSTLFRTRKHLEELGYWTYVSGRGMRATVYHLSDAPVAGILENLKAKKAARSEETKRRQIAHQSGNLTLQSMHNSKRAMARLAKGLALQSAHKPDRRSGPKKGDPTLQIGHLDCASIAGITPLSSPHRTLPVKEVPQEARAPVPTEARASPTARCDMCTKPAAFWCSFIEKGFCSDHRWLVTEDSDENFNPLPVAKSVS